MFACGVVAEMWAPIISFLSDWLQVEGASTLDHRALAKQEDIEEKASSSAPEWDVPYSVALLTVVGSLVHSSACLSITWSIINENQKQP